MKGEERVCHVTEADAPGAKLVPAKAGGAGCIREVSSCEAAWAWGVLPLCAAVLCGGTQVPPGIKRK